LNYDQYNPTLVNLDGQSGGQRNGVTDGILKKDKESTKKEQVLPLPPQGDSDQKVKTKRATHDPEKLKIALSAVNQADLFREFEPQGLDVRAWWDDFCDYVMTGGSKGTRPNPSKWTDFTKAAKNSARTAATKGWFMAKIQKSSTSWIDEAAQND
jgi:hypothetical protein